MELILLRSNHILRRLVFPVVSADWDPIPVKPMHLAQETCDRLVVFWRNIL